MKRTHRNPGWWAAEEKEMQSQGEVKYFNLVLIAVCFFLQRPATQLYSNHKCEIGYALENNREDKSPFYFESSCSFHAKLLVFPPIK